MAIGILVAEEVIPHDAVKNCVLVGELSLDGRIKPVPGALSVALLCRKRYALLTSPENAGEAAVVEGVDAYAVHTCPRSWNF